MVPDRNDRMQEGSTAVALAMVTPGYDQDPASGVADYTTHQDQAQFEADKRAVYKHPLFPLLALLFERCEQATQGSDNSTSESFNMDIEAFVQHQERDRKPFLINDPEIDGLVLSSTGNDVEPGANGFRVSRGDTLSENGGASQMAAQEETGNDRPPSVRSSSTAQRSNRSSSQDHDDPLSPSTVHGSTPLSQIGVHPCAPVNDMYLGQDDMDYVSDRIYLEEAGYWGLLALQERENEYVDVGDANDEKYFDITVAGSPSPAPSEDEDEGCGTGTATSNHSSSHGGSHSSIKKGRQKRGVLPKQATSIMRTWLFEHIVHPYPTEDEKRQIASQTNLTLLQVNNWFINARRRILQPMLDGAGADPVQRAGKRHKVSKHVVQQQHVQQQQASGWQSEDSGSDSGSSDGEGGADRSKDGNDSDEDDLH
ncbi:homeobox protein homothorax-like isoform X3 [Colletes gigas]|uniref:homeobox protein homothorax-like isoform X3 n=1 Tax=Colletes gigas TaxID=935657 RepID=UPI001C9B43ED|nr:homeobox protein homothorax-like isoform X3 [Colletes gigas]